MRQRLWRHVRAFGLLPALAAVAVGFHILSGGRFLTAVNIGVLLHQGAVNTVLSAGMTFVVLAGGIDLSVSAILAAAIVAGLMASHITGLAALWPLASLAVGLGCGLMNGVLIASLRLPPFILTLATMTVVLGAARAVTDDGTMDNARLPHAWLASSALLGVPSLAILSLLVVVVAWLILTRTVVGLSVYTVGGNRAAAHLAGIAVPRIDCVVYGLSGLLSGVGAVMVAIKLHGANAMQVSQTYTLDAVAAVILGGTSIVGGIGSIWGTYTGALLIVALSNGLVLTGVPDMWQSVVKGVVIIGAVALDRARPTRSA